MTHNSLEIPEGSNCQGILDRSQRLTIPVDVGGGAVMTIANPRPPDDSGLTWRLMYGDTHQYRASAVSVIDSYDYLLWSEITTNEAIRRLRLLRVARRRAEELHR